MIEAKFRIVTPLFMGGADQSTPELRVPGIKGALRFWWRALAWNWCKGDLSKIRDLEGRIFGSTEHGQSGVIMDLCGANAKFTNESFFEKRQGLMYLGYGPIEKGKLTRDYLKPPVDAILRIRIRPKNSDEKAPSESIADQLSKALIAMGLFGGLGSRSRRGFGSFNLIELNVDGKTKFKCPNSKDQLKEEIRKFIKCLNLYDTLPEYTAFSPKTEIYLFKNMNTDPLGLLDGVGNAMIEYRLGTRGKSSGKRIQSRFKADTELAKKIALGEQVNGHPRRLFFGLPHNYHFKDLEKNLEIRGTNHNRRASPLLIHVQMVGTQYTAVATLMPAMFLPSDEQILIRATEEKKKDGGWRMSVDSSSFPESRVNLDTEEAEELMVIRDFLNSSFKRVYPNEHER